MCYGMRCEHERSDGTCSKPRGEECPSYEYDHEAAEEYEYRMTLMQREIEMEMKAYAAPAHGHPVQEPPFEPGLDYTLMDYAETNISGGYDV